MKKTAILLSFQTIAMAIVHFVLPIIFKWETFLNPQIQTINWALFALNNYFSFIILALGAMLLIKTIRNKPIMDINIIIGLFWLFSVVYQFSNPMPLPKQFAALSWILPSTAILNLTLSIYLITKGRKTY